MDKKGLKERFEEALEAAGFVIDWDRLKEVVEEIEKAFAAIGIMAQDAINALSATYEEIEEAFWNREPRPAAEDGAEPGAGHRTAIPGGDSPRRAGKILQADI